MQCSTCERPILRRYIQRTKTGKHFCNRACHRQSQWKHGLNAGGYRVARVNGRQVYEHRLIMEQILGRDLKSTEHVHHRNEVKSDNRQENLVVLTESAHHRSHSPLQFDIAAARRLYLAGVGYKLLGQLFARSALSIREVFLRRGWHIPNRPKPPADVTAAALQNIVGVAYQRGRTKPLPSP